MNSIKIEKTAIDFLKSVINSHDKMNDYINVNDKEPSWDGNIYLYNTDSLKVEDIRYKIPVQVKGKNKEELLKRKNITYPVEYKHLRNYYIDGGVCYFVIIVSDDGNNNAIFYNALTPIKLQRELKGTESKQPNQTKNITLSKLEKNNSNKLYNILLQFGYDSEHQGSGNGEIIRKSINKDSIKEIDSLRTMVFDDKENITPNEVFDKIINGEVCVYGHRKDSDTWYPLQVEQQSKIEICTEVNKGFGIGNKIFYDKYLKRSEGENEVYELSKNVALYKNRNAVLFKPISTVMELKRDIRFLEELPKGNVYCEDGKELFTYECEEMPQQIKKMVEFLKSAILALEHYDIIIEKPLSEFHEGNWKALNLLVNMYLGKVKPKDENDWKIWWWEGKAYPILLAKQSNGEIYSYNFTTTNKFGVFVEYEGAHYSIPNFIMYKRDIWEKLFDVEEAVIIERIKYCGFNEILSEDYSHMMIEILAAYDTTKNEKYFNIVKFISDKLYEMDPNRQYWIINKLQLIKRKRDFTDDEIKELEEILENPIDDLVSCAVDILLENKHSARKKIKRLPDEDRELFEKFPIKNLL